jgi:phage terminase Nu1 subunit (DNA packaging protein)
LAEAPQNVPERWRATHRETAELLGISEPALTKAVQERGCPIVEAGGPGKKAVYDLRAVIGWRTAELRAALKEAEVQKARLNKAQADRTELEMRVRRGELVDRERMEQAMASVLLTVRDGILALPKRNAPDLAATTDEIEVRQKLDKELRAVLQALVVTMGTDEPRKRRKR